MSRKQFGFAVVVSLLVGVSTTWADDRAQPGNKPVAEPRKGREQLLKEVALPALRLAVKDLAETFAGRYPRGREFLERIDLLEKAAATADVGRLKWIVERVERLRRDALLANPLLVRQPIVFVVRAQFRTHYHAIDTLFHTGELNPDRGMKPHADLFEGGGALKILDPATGRVTTLLETPQGVVRGPDVHYSGRKIVFAWRRNTAEDYHLFEINADGTELVQRTTAVGVSDFDPAYLPDDDIVFSSTREPKYNMCSRDHGANLFRMEADGANIHQIGKNNLFDNQASVLPDGRILYARWEYVDRNFGDAHGIWTVHPDGTNQAIYWGNNKASPAGVYYPRLISGTDRVVCVFSMHHHRMWGALAIVDHRLGIDGREPVVHIWPPDAMNLVRTGGPFACDAFAGVYPKYECPYPLSEKYILCSRMTMRPKQQKTRPDAQFGEEMAIYLIDVFGNEVLVHTEEPGCYDPAPLAARPRPPVLPDRPVKEDGQGQFYVANVYAGTHMAGVKPGSVKWLRVVESPEKRHWSPGMWFGQGYTAPGMNWHSLENKRILGTVPVEADGSAYFSVPADKFVYFQLLDENRMMIQSMRSGAVVHAGESIGCVGCHDDRRGSPPALKATPLAMQRRPSRLEDWYGAPRNFGYTAEVQPVFDRHCVGCHDFNKPADKKLNLAGDCSVTFNISYEELWRKRMIACVGAGPAEVQAAYSWGSHRSRLVEELRQPKAPEHQGLRLSREEMDRIITWTDLNGVYYPEYACAYPNSLTGRCPLENAELSRLASLTGMPLIRGFDFDPKRAPQVSFERPELSPCLAKWSDQCDSGYREALAIIEAGGEMLRNRPRCGMPGFVPCEADRCREAKYSQLRAMELHARNAIRRGEKVYDPPAPAAADRSPKRTP